MLRHGDKVSDSREVLVDELPANGDVIVSSGPEVAEVGVSVSSLATSTTTLEDEPTMKRGEVQLGVTALQAANNTSQLAKSASSRNRTELTSTRPSANVVPMSANGNQYGSGRHRGRKSVVAATQDAMERVEIAAELDLISVLGVKRTSRNLTYFVILYSAVLCVIAAFRAHLRGIEYHLGRKYFLSGSQLRLVVGFELVGVVVALAFVALFGRRCHKPMLMFCGTLVCAVGCIVCPVSYFVESARNGAPRYHVVTPTRDVSNNYSTVTGSSSNFSLPVPDVVEYLLTEVCSTPDVDSTSTDSLSAWYSDACFAMNSTASSTYASVTYSTLLIGVLLHGVGTGMITTTGFIYIDENALNKPVAVYLGVILSMSGFGEFIGSCIAWWFTSYSLHLTSHSNSERAVAEWEHRAWWLGFIVLSAALFIVSGMFLVYPKWIVEPSWVTVSRQRHLRRLQRLVDWHKEDRRRRREQRKRLRDRERRRLYSADSSISNQLSGTADVSHQHGKRPSDTSSLTSSAVTSLVGATDRQTSLSSAQISDPLTDLTNLSWTSLTPVHKDNDMFCDDDLVAFGDDEDDDVIQPSSQPACYSNTLFDIDEEETDISGSVVASDGGRGPRSRGVQFDVADDEDRPTRPQLTAVITRDRKPTVFEKKYEELRSMLTVPVYTLSLVAAVFAAFLLAGYRTNAARFVQLQYGYEYQHAWFYTNGLCFGLALTVGPVVGGVIVHKLRLTMHRQQLKLIITMLIISAVMLLLLLAVDCPDAGFVWQNTTVTQEQGADGSQQTWIESCSAKCSCSSDKVGVQLEPVCITDGRRYYSPCHAGCTRLQQTSDGQIVFSDCSCTDSSTHESTECVSNCSIYGAYWIILFLAVISHSMAQVGVVMLFIRTVSAKRRMLSFGFAVWVIVVLAFVPGVALYRAIETTSCVDDMSLLDCHSELICWRHDLERYRYLTHAVTAAFHAAAVLLFTVALFLSPASEAPDAADEQPVSRSRRNTAVHISNSAEPRTPVICNDDVMTGASPASQSLEHSESVHDTHM